MKKTHILAILVAILIGLLIAIAAIDPLRIAVRNFLAGVGGGTFVAFENGWSVIVANPLYLQLHVFLWFFAGMIFLGCLIIADRKGKIPLRRAKKTPQPAPMGAPQTILVTAAPAPTNNAAQQQPQQQPNPNPPATPPDQNKAAGT